LNRLTPDHPFGFESMESRGILDMIGILAKVAQDVSWRAKNGIEMILMHLVLSLTMCITIPSLGNDQRHQVLLRVHKRRTERDENISGKKDNLIAQLLRPSWNEYAPKVPLYNAALMVALLLNHIPGTQ
ncbi:hypothetical protein ACHAXA_010177, partial [Cyclostephanos tholiformis]